MGKLSDKVAVITGGNSGIGLSTAKRFAEEGACVYIIARRHADVDAAVATIGPRGRGVAGDVTNDADLDRLYSKIETEQGQIDIVFANAGTFADNAPLGEITEDQFDHIFGINVRAVLFTVQKALPLMRDGGSIIINASAASVMGVALLSLYSASKAAVRSFARTWTAELAPRMIRSNVISPAWIDTPLLSAAGMSNEQIVQFREMALPLIPLRRFAGAEDVANAVLFLASDDSAFISGHELFIDGGTVSI
ncbi:NAD(P)-dependent dehydrogenase (short-subunit alcohol dehydrogenase family) [Bradyrhizobium japonicum]